MGVDAISCPMKSLKIHEMQRKQESYNEVKGNEMLKGKGKGVVGMSNTE